MVSVLTTNPAILYGDGPVFEQSSDVQPGAYPAKLLTGYLGSVGGYIPQQIRMYVFERNGMYITFTLYALGLRATEGDVTQIAPINIEEQNIFDNMVAGLRFQ